MANCGLPGTSGFVGEFLVILGTMEENFWYAFAAASTLVFGAAYTLWMIKRVVFRRGGQRPGRGLTDITLREGLVLGLSQSRCWRWACIPGLSPRCCRLRSVNY